MTIEIRRVGNGRYVIGKSKKLTEYEITGAILLFFSVTFFTAYYFGILGVGSFFPRNWLHTGELLLILLIAWGIYLKWEKAKKKVWLYCLVTVFLMVLVIGPILALFGYIGYKIFIE